MLTASDALRAGGRRRSPPSLTHLYHEYIMQRIEDFKDSIPRDELMRLGDEARLDFESHTSDQFFLTEVLAAEIVDQYLMKRLKLPTFRKWQREFLPRRNAQRQPTRWGLDRSCPVVPLLNRLEPTDRALVVGEGAEACVYLLAAHDVAVTFMADDPGRVDRVDSTVSSEALGARYLSWVVQLGRWIPCAPVPFDLVVLDTHALTALDAAARVAAVAALQAQSAPTATHVLLATEEGIVPEAVFACYGDAWQHESAPRSGRTKLSGVVLSRTAPPATAEAAAQA